MKISGRKLVGRARSLDPVRVDYGAALLIMVALEVAAWTGSGVEHRWVAAAAAIVTAGMLAVRRRWILQALAIGVACAALVALIYGSVSRGGQGLVGGIAGILVFYGAGAFLPRRLSWIGLALGMAGATINSVASESQVMSSLVFADGLVVTVPWLLGRTFTRAGTPRPDGPRAGRAARLRARAPRARGGAGRADEAGA